MGALDAVAGLIAAAGDEGGGGRGSGSGAAGQRVAVVALALAVGGVVHLHAAQRLAHDQRGATAALQEKSGKPTSRRLKGGKSEWIRVGRFTVADGEAVRILAVLKWLSSYRSSSCVVAVGGMGETSKFVWK